MTVTQELYDAIYFNLEKNYVVYESLPDSSATYPFVVLGEMQQTKSNFKTALGTRINLTIDVWGDRESRFSVDAIMNDIEKVSRVVTKHYYFVKRIDDSDSQLLHDNSTDVDLLHGVINLAFSITRKEK